MYTKQLEPSVHEQWARVSFVRGGQQVTQDVVFRFLDVEELAVPKEYQWAYDEISELLLDLPKDANDDLTQFYKTLLINLRSSLGEKDEMSSLVIDLRRLLTDNPNLLEAKHNARVTTLLKALSDSTVQSSF